MQRLYWHRSLRCYRLIDSAGEPHRQLDGQYSSLDEAIADAIAWLEPLADANRKPPRAAGVLRSSRGLRAQRSDEASRAATPCFQGATRLAGVAQTLNKRSRSRCGVLLFRRAEGDELDLLSPQLDFKLIAGLQIEHGGVGLAHHQVAVELDLGHVAEACGHLCQCPGQSYRCPS
jgi:hypothetical protein